ncbi:bifunctional diguanylate cyclase/phosphodiesterase [Anaerolentibacter hominis]|uniref:putative bifunctional diguanylate cyclase/phosphodiesterase n=1 Tax=Anaerolentibacter hominis TaxID=3079009 RepID=UPI0031B83DA3
MDKKIRGKWLLPVFVLLLLFVSGTSIKLISEISNYGKLINYVGIVRGASQRVVKLETNHMPSQNLVEYVDNILSELQTGKGRYGLVLTNSEKYNTSLDRLEKQWEFVQDKIKEVRAGGDESALISASEELFVIANDTVFAIEEYSDHQIGWLSRLILVTAAAWLVVGILVAYIYVKRFFALTRTNRVLKDMTNRDELTGALNLERFKEDSARILADYPNEKFAFLYIDFENFKYVNDVLGYEQGDQLLKKYVELMTEHLTEAELIGRNVADRFVALRHYSGKEEILSLQKHVDQEFLESSKAVTNRHILTIACGICCIEDIPEKLDVEALIDRANFAQKTVKNKPDEHYAFYDESIRRKMIAENAIRNRMDDALFNREFVVYMQPKVNPATGKIECAEALVRWNSPDGMLLPGVFIPIFENTHFIGKLDRYVFEEVCRWISGRLKAGKPVTPVSVNVSKLQFCNMDFVDIYTDIKDKYQIPDGCLELEFTESVAFGNVQYMQQIVSSLHRHGFLCSMDDFGKGYSSLGMLNDMDIDVLKLDAAFFREEVSLKKNEIIIRSIISMVRQLGIQMVAEGIEKKEQVELLQEVGCDLIQGFYYYRPMPIEEFENKIEQEHDLAIQAG